MRKALKPKVVVELDELTNSCFVIMPFDAKFTEEYEKVIQPAIKKAGLECIRADRIYSDKPVMEDIWRQIRACKLAIAELTGKNLNVLYEIGLAHALGKPVILITRKEKDVPFDLRNIRYLFYDTNISTWGEDLKTGLVELINTINTPRRVPLLKGICCKNHTYPACYPTERPKNQQYEANGICGRWSGSWIMQDTKHEIALHIFYDDNDYRAISYITIYGSKGETQLQQILAKNRHNKTDVIEFNGTNYSFLKNENDFPIYLLDVIEIKSHQNNSLMGKIRDNRNRVSADLPLYRI